MVTKMRTKAEIIKDIKTKGSKADSLAKRVLNNLRLLVVGFGSGIILMGTIASWNMMTAPYKVFFAGFFSSSLSCIVLQAVFGPRHPGLSTNSNLGLGLADSTGRCTPL